MSRCLDSDPGTVMLSARSQLMHGNTSFHHTTSPDLVQLVCPWRIQGNYIMFKCTHHCCALFRPLQNHMGTKLGHPLLTSGSNESIRSRGGSARPTLNKPGVLVQSKRQGRPRRLNCSLGMEASTPLGPIAKRAMDPAGLALG